VRFSLRSKKLLWRTCWVLWVPQQQPAASAQQFFFNISTMLHISQHNLFSKKIRFRQQNCRFNQPKK
jgi:hypothetical protein